LIQRNFGGHSETVIHFFRNETCLAVRITASHMRQNFITISSLTVQKLQLDIHFFHSSTASVGLTLLCKVPRSPSDTPHLVELLWTSDKFVAETSTCTMHNNHKRHTPMSLVEFEPATPSKQATADPHRRPRDHSGRSDTFCGYQIL